MRKIIILFVVSCVMVIGGSCIFALEISNIEETTVVQKSTMKKEIKKVDSSIKTVIVDDNLYSLNDQSVAHPIYINRTQDDSLDPYEIEIEYNDTFKVETENLSDECRIQLISNLTWAELNNARGGFEEALQIWKSKKIENNNFDSNYFNVNIRYGSKLEVYSSVEYSHLNIVDGHDYEQY